MYREGGPGDCLCSILDPHLDWMAGICLAHTPRQPFYGLSLIPGGISHAPVVFGTNVYHCLFPSHMVHIMAIVIG